MFTLQMLPAEPDGLRREVAESVGFSPFAGIAAKAWQCDKLEQLARYVHGVFVPASPDQARVVPKTRAAAAGTVVESSEPSATPRSPSIRGQSEPGVAPGRTVGLTASSS